MTPFRNRGRYCCCRRRTFDLPLGETSRLMGLFGGFVHGCLHLIFASLWVTSIVEASPNFWASLWGASKRAVVCVIF